MEANTCYNNQQHIIATLEIGPGVRLTAGEIVDTGTRTVDYCRRCGRLIEAEPFEMSVEAMLETLP